MKLNQTKQDIKKSVLKSLKLNNLDELNSEKKYDSDTDDDDEASLDSDQEVKLTNNLLIYRRYSIFFNFYSFYSCNWRLHANS